MSWAKSIKRVGLRLLTQSNLFYSWNGNGYKTILQKMYDVQAINYRCDRFYFDSHDDDIQDCAEDISRSFSVGFKDCELMQSTGLRDKNGVEIFEGDIIQAYRNLIGQIIFDDRGKFFGLKISDVETHGFSMNYLEGQKIEVLGNIYENPELIEAKNDD